MLKSQPLEDVGRGGAHIRLLLLAHHVDVHVLVARVLAHDLALVGLLPGLDEEGAAVLQADEGVGGDGPGAVGHERAGGARDDPAGPGLVTLRNGGGDAGTSNKR